MMMKALVSLALALASPVVASAQATGAGATNPAFERLKSLQGTWTGPATHGGQPAGEATVVYKVTGGGSVVEETLVPGTPHEMVTMYHLDGPRVMLTHYCSSGNQPRMTLEPGTDPNVLAFMFSGGTNMKESDAHMHSVRIIFKDADHISAVWASMKDGRPAGEVRFELSRKK